LTIALTCGGAIIGLVLFEGILRISRPDAAFGAVTEMPWMRANPEVANLYTVDADFGFRPRLGTSEYSEFATHRNEYSLEKPAGKKRLLFIGDSVTSRGKIIDALREVHGDADFEFWNAGVESFNTVQEVRLYERFNAAIEPEHVILTFHPNDFEVTPVAFVTEEGRLAVYVPDSPLRPVNRSLFAWSYLYRWFIGKTLNSHYVREKTVTETREHLLRLRNSLRQDGVAFSVILLPKLKPLDSWTPAESTAREDALGIMRTLDLEYYDLLDPLRMAINDGVDVQERAGDADHPSAAVCEVFARYLESRGLLTRPQSR
jgi:hypothetical protein